MASESESSEWMPFVGSRAFACEEEAERSVRWWGCVCVWLVQVWVKPAHPNVLRQLETWMTGVLQVLKPSSRLDVDFLSHEECLAKNKQRVRVRSFRPQLPETRRGVSGKCAGVCGLGCLCSSDRRRALRVRVYRRLPLFARSPLRSPHGCRLRTEENLLTNNSSSDSPVKTLPEFGRRRFPLRCFRAQTGLFLKRLRLAGPLPLRSSKAQGRFSRSAKWRSWTRQARETLTSRTAAREAVA